MMGLPWSVLREALVSSLNDYCEEAWHGPYPVPDWFYEQEAQAFAKWLVGNYEAGDS